MIPERTMGTARKPLSVKLFSGMLSNDVRLFDEAAELLAAEYGPIDMKSGLVPWNWTDHYREEMGNGLLRRFVFFERLADPAVLPSLKLFTNRAEERFATRDGIPRRRINLDPGYLTEAKVVLATTKDYAHRIYIGAGIYAEVPLNYHGNGFVPLGTTYPDYRSAEVLLLFTRARELLRSALGTCR